MWLAFRAAAMTDPELSAENARLFDGLGVALAREPRDELAERERRRQCTATLWDHLRRFANA